MCLSDDVFSTLCFGLVPIVANIMLLFVTECRAYMSFGSRAWARMVFQALLFTIPVAGTILLWQSWFYAGQPASICVDRGTFLAGAFSLSALLAFLTAGHAQVYAASGINPSVRFADSSCCLALVFLVARLSIGFLRH